MSVSPFSDMEIWGEKTGDRRQNSGVAGVQELQNEEVIQFGSENSEKISWRFSS
jgi:hypothetical protein